MELIFLVEGKQKINSKSDGGECWRGTGKSLIRGIGNAREGELLYAGW